METKAIIKHSGKALTTAGIVVGGIFVLKNLILISIIGTVGFGFMYFKELRKVGGLGKYLFEKTMKNKFPIFYMEAKKNELEEKKTKLEDKQKLLARKIGEINEKINQASQKEQLKGTVEPLTRLKETLEKHKERLDVLGLQVKNHAEALESKLESRKLVYDTMSEAVALAKDVKGLVGEKFTEDDNIDIIMAGMNGELEELLRQVDNEIR